MSRDGPLVGEEEDRVNPPNLEQREALLSTKLFIPPLRPNRMNRPRLDERMNSGLDKTLILVSAPAGYGKTTLVSGWLHTTQVPATWISLDEGDNDPIHFLQYFIGALRKVVPAIKPDLLGVLQGNQPGAYKFLLNIVINEIAGRGAPFILVLDDFHVIYAQPVLEILAHLIDHAPPQMHLACLTRTDPPLPLARLRARDQLVEIRAAQLRFTQPEITCLLNETLPLKLSASDIAALEARTEGWIAGLQLASLALQAMASQPRFSAPAGDDVRGFIAAFTGSHHYIMDYLADEVLRLQDEATRSFLLQSSILERMCGPLCDELLQAGAVGPVNGQARLEALEQMNLFIIPLDEQRRWYRYHHLFAEVLNRQLEQSYPQHIPGLHRRAARWYAQNGFMFEAIRHTLLAGDKEGAARLVDQHGCELLMRGEVVNLLRWIEAVEPYSQTFPWIAIQKAWALCLTGQPERADAPLQAASRLIAALALTDEVKTMTGAVIAARAYRANLHGQTRQAAGLARQALEALPASNNFSCSLRSAATSILGDACWMGGSLAEAQDAYASAVQIGQAAGSIHMGIVSGTNLAEVLLEQGQLQSAARRYSRTLQMARLPDGQISPLAERVYAGLSRVSYEWNHLEEAAGYIQQCIDLSQRWGSLASQAIGYEMAARLALARGRPEEALQATHALEQVMDGQGLSPWQLAAAQSALARLWVAQGDLERAAGIVEETALPGDGSGGEPEISTLQVPYDLARLHLELRRGAYDALLELAGPLLCTLEGTRRVGRTIEALLLQALAYQGKRELERALPALERALSLAQPERYVRTFLDEGEPLAKLLYQARVHRPGSGYVGELLSALGEPAGSKLPPAQMLIEPLTGRELEVLARIEAGCSNQEIAAEFFISLPTVKRHISNIYAKLGAGSRTQALARAKELKLFP